MSTPRTGEPLYRQRPGAEAIMPATDAPAVDLGDGLWMSSGLSNSYMLRTAEGRVVVNCGMGFESPYHRAAFDAVDRSPVHTILLTQGHPDHFGGVDQFRDGATRIVTHANFRIFREASRSWRRTAFATRLSRGWKSCRRRSTTRARQAASCQVSRVRSRRSRSRTGSTAAPLPHPPRQAGSDHGKSLKI
jgi:hypothetical protein